MKKQDAYDFLPEFPRTPHLPIEPNLEEGDVVVDKSFLQDIFKEDSVLIEEKVDGANIGVCYFQGNFYVRSRRHFLKKGFLHKNPSGQQFRPLWNWLYQHQGNFQLLNRMPPFSEEQPATVYGEWCWMAHGIHYTKLPDFFLAYDLYDSHEKRMLYNRYEVRAMLKEAGFEIPSLLHSSHVVNEHQLLSLRENSSSLTNGFAEGIYIRIRDWKNKSEKRYKMVRPDFERGKFFRENEIIRNLKRKD